MVPNVNVKAVLLFDKYQIFHSHTVIFSSMESLVDLTLQKVYSAWDFSANCSK